MGFFYETADVYLQDVKRLYPRTRQAIIIQRASSPFFINSIMHIPIPIQKRIKPINRFMSSPPVLFFSLTAYAGGREFVMNVCFFCPFSVK